MSKRICITGGAGYIGSHTLLAALEAGYEVLVLDSLERGYALALERVKELTGREFAFAQVDLRDAAATREALVEFQPAAVVHFAAYKSVGEGEQEPGKYHENNVAATENLLRAMVAAGTKQLVFSSSAAVYGTPGELPLSEDSPTNPISVYGRTKLEMEELITRYAREYGWQAWALRYFNAVGAHPSGRLGEDPARSTNIVPIMMQVLTGSRDELTLFGADFDTADGSQERDYIHVTDLAAAHLKALETTLSAGTMQPLNLSCNRRTSCLELITLLEEVTGQSLPYRVGAARAGDPEQLYARSDLAQELLRWHPQASVRQCLEDQWRWTQAHPRGYAGEKRTAQK